MKKFKVLIFLFLLLSIISTCAYAQEEMSLSLGKPSDIFKKGNSYYEAGDYEKAIKEYEKITQMGKQSGPVYYNLANSYFKTGKYGLAILNYERAERLMPRDADVKANYRFARSMVKDKMIPKDGIWGWKPFLDYYTSFTINELTWISSFLFIFLLTAIFLSITSTIKFRYKILLIISSSIMLIISTATVYYKTYSIGKDAIVISSRADVLYGPFSTATKFFTLHEGSNVAILETKGDWYKVRRSDNKAGWVPKKTVEAI